MPTYRVPYLLWPDAAGKLTGALLEDHEGIAYGHTQREIEDQLVAYLQWCCRERRDEPADGQGAEVVVFSVSIRPEYKTLTTRHPCEEAIAVKVPCVCTARGSAKLAALPTLGLSFHFQNKSALRGLVEQYVREKMGGLAPRELSRLISHGDAALGEVVLRAARREEEREHADLTVLEEVAEPLGERGLRRQMAFAWEREAEVAALVRRLREERASVVLCGPSGAGKSAILASAVREIERRVPGEKPDPDEVRARHRFWLTRAGRLIAGMKYLGQWEERCEDLIGKLEEIDGVLCIDRLLDLVRTGGIGPEDSLAAFCLPYLQHGELRIAGEATPEEWLACQRLLPAFASQFQVLSVPPMKAGAGRRVLQRVAANLKEQLRVEPAPEVPARILELFGRFQPYLPLPGRAVEFLREAAHAARRVGLDRLDGEAVAAHFTRKSGLPPRLLDDAQALALEDVASALKARVIGQDAACEALAPPVVAFKAGMNDPRRPLGVFLFCGPTGVGKTELARTLATFLFGQGEEAGRRLVRLDMTEYAEAWDAPRLLEKPDGEPGEMLQRLRQQPFSVLLLDEIEKAAPEVFDVLLNLFDDGRLTGPDGRAVFFRSAFVILTSNLGSERMQTAGLRSATGPSYQSEARAFFRPEFFNRLDRIVEFEPLSPEAVLRIAEKELGELPLREGLRGADISLTWSPAVPALLAREGFDRRFGARPLQRCLEQRVVAPLARLLATQPGRLRGARLVLDLDSAGHVSAKHL